MRSAPAANSPVAAPSTRSMPFGSGPIAVTPTGRARPGAGPQRADHEVAVLEPRRRQRQRGLAAASTSVTGPWPSSARGQLGLAAVADAVGQPQRLERLVLRRRSTPPRRRGRAPRRAARGRPAARSSRRRRATAAPRRRSGGVAIATTAAGPAVARGLVERGRRAVHPPRPVRRVAPAAVEQHEERRRPTPRAAGSAPARRRRGSPPPARSIRSSSSHQGVRSGIFSGSVSPSSSRTPGKRPPPRRRRHRAQQPPQHRQRDEPEQQPGREEGDRTRSSLSRPLADRHVEPEQRRARRLAGVVEQRSASRGGGRSRRSSPAARPAASRRRRAAPGRAGSRTRCVPPMLSKIIRPSKGKTSSLSSSTCTKQPRTPWSAAWASAGFIASTSPRKSEKKIARAAVRHAVGRRHAVVGPVVRGGSVPSASAMRLSCARPARGCAASVPISATRSPALISSTDSASASSAARSPLERARKCSASR